VIYELFKVGAIENMVYPSQPYFHTGHGAALNKVYCQTSWELLV